jgi:hypothetical protein
MKFYKEINGESVFFTGRVLTTEQGTIFNPTEEQMLDAGWLVYVEPEPTNAQKLAAAKAEKIAQIETYDSSDAVEQFTINDVPMWLNHELRQQIRTSAESYSAMGAETMTKVFNGAEFTFPITQWIQMLNALEVYAAEALNTTERHKNAVQAMTRRKDVEDYDYTTGYPEKLTFGE